MSFIFSMQKILNYREQMEEEARVRLAQVQRLYIVEEQRFIELKALLHEKESLLYQTLVHDAGEHWLMENFIKGLRADMVSTQLRLRALHQALLQARHHAIDCAKNKKMLEKLKERQKLRHNKDERDKEQKNYDETATLRHNAAPF